VKLVFVPAVETRRPYVVTHLGYTYCQECADRMEIEGETYDARGTGIMDCPDTYCEGCGRSPRAWSTVEVHGTATVELTPAKIF